MKSLTKNPFISPYNKLVRQTYFQLLKETKALLATVEDEPLRYTLIREDKLPITQGTIVHELISPLVYLRLECYAEDKLGIHYGFELSPTFGQYYHIMNHFVRLVYKLTMCDATSINIEDCIRTDYLLNECSGLYEYTEERGCKHHIFVQTPYKAKTPKRKLRKVA